MLRRRAALRGRGPAGGAHEATTGPLAAPARRERAADLANTLGDPDPPECQTGPPEPDSEELARRARMEALLNVMRGGDLDEDVPGVE